MKKLTHNAIDYRAALIGFTDIEGQNKTLKIYAVTFQGLHRHYVMEEDNFDTVGPQYKTQAEMLENSYNYVLESWAGSQEKMDNQWVMKVEKPEEKEAPISNELKSLIGSAIEVLNQHPTEQRDILNYKLSKYL